MDMTFPCLVTRLSQMNGLSHCRSGTLNVLELEVWTAEGGDPLVNCYVNRWISHEETNIFPSAEWRNKMKKEKKRKEQENLWLQDKLLTSTSNTGPDGSVQVDPKPTKRRRNNNHKGEIYLRRSVRWCIAGFVTTCLALESRTRKGGK